MALCMKYDADQIRQQLATLLEAWKSGEVDLLDACVAEEPYAYFNTHWNCYTRNDLKMQLTMTGKEITVSRMAIANEMSIQQGDRAVQYATIIGLFANEDGHLAFGGTFTNKLEKQQGAWIFTELRFELQTDNAVKSYALDQQGHVSSIPGPGDLALIEKWKKVNTSIGLFMDPVPGQSVHTIMAEFDAPWYVLPQGKGAACNEEALKQVFLKYCYALDQNCPALLDGVFAKDARFLSNQVGEMGMKDAVNYLTIIRQASARSFHAVRFEDVQVEGNAATMKAIRLLPELAQVDGNMQMNCDVGEYTLAFANNNGAWQITRFAYQSFCKEGAQG